MNNDDLVDQWIQCQYLDPSSPDFESYSHVSGCLIDLAIKQPDILLRIILEIIEKDASDNILGALGAGLIEDLIVNHESRVVDRVVELAGSNPDFKKALKYTYLDESDVSASNLSKIRGALLDK